MVRAILFPSSYLENAEEIRESVEKLLGSRWFLKSDRLCRFVRLAVNHALSGTQQRLKEYIIGVEVFDRGVDYDPRVDPIVRVEARRLRTKLKGYYSAAGRQDQLRIEFPKGSYSPIFRVKTARADSLQPNGESSAGVKPQFQPAL